MPESSEIWAVATDDKLMRAINIAADRKKFTFVMSEDLVKRKGAELAQLTTKVFKRSANNLDLAHFMKKLR